MKALTAALLLATLQCSWALTPTDCNATKPLAEKALDLINKWRRDGYLFQLLRVADAHLDGAESATVYYLVLDVKETDCSVLTRKHWEDCDPDLTKRPSVDVIGQCKVIATIYSDEYQTLRMNDFNCTTSSVSSALANTKDSPVLFDFIEDTEPFRKSADKALEEYRSENEAYASFRVDRVERVTRVRGGERTNYYVDFSVRNCSRSHFHRHPDFGFCRADLSFDVGASDLENPEDVIISCEVFNFEEHGNISGFRPHLGKTPLGADGSRDHHHPHKPHKFGCPPPQEGEDFSDRPPSQGGTPPLSPPSGPRCRLRPFGTNETHRFPHHRNFSEHHHHGPPPHGHPPHGHHPHGPPPHGHHPHGPPPHGHHPHGPPPHGHHPHGPPPHGHHPHGPPPHGHHPHGPPPHGHHPHGPPPHGHPPHGPPPHGHHPHGHGFHDHGPCDPPSHREGPQDLLQHGHGPPPKHPGKRGPGKGHFPFHWRRIGSVYQLPPLQKGEVLPLPEANFPSFSLLNHTHPLKPEIQPFPQIASERCPGEFNGEFAQLSKFFPSTFPK